MELLKITIPKFARTVTVSQARRANYYHEGEKIPKKYSGKDFAFKIHNKKMILFNVVTNKPVVKNPNTAGQPREEIISGNSVWDTLRIGNYTELIKLSVQKYFWDVIVHFELDKIDIRDKTPLRVHFEFYTHKEAQDTDNLDLIYRKAFLDAIQDRPEYMIYDVGPRLIKSDGPKTIKSIYTDHHDCMLDEERLVITISTCDNKLINYDDIIWKINLTELNLEK